MYHRLSLLSGILSIHLVFNICARAQAFDCGLFLTEGRVADTATADKPQSKAWHHAGRWWCALSDRQALSVYRLDETGWSKHLDLMAQGFERADCLPDGDDVYILAYTSRSPTLHKIHYNGTGYNFSEGWETPVELSLSQSSETATIARDTTGRLWIGTDGSRAVDVYYSSGGERDWSGPITIREGITSDDICAITALAGGKIGVMWSDQSRMEFGFAVHRDGDAPENWTLEAVTSDGPLADDHINLAQATDGTLYAAVKTEFDATGRPQLGVLRRSPSGEWSDLAPVTVLSATDTGTRPIVVLNEERGELYVFYTNWADSPRTISVKTARTDDLLFPRESIRIAIQDGDLNNATSTRQIVGHETGVLILSTPSRGRAVHYCLIRDFEVLTGHSGIAGWND